MLKRVWLCNAQSTYQTFLLDVYNTFCLGNRLYLYEYYFDTDLFHVQYRFKCRASKKADDDYLCHPINL
jgi:hypothetical protein